MRSPKDLEKLVQILSEEGLPALAGETLAFALAPPMKREVIDTERRIESEAEDAFARAIEYLQSQLVLAERHLGEAEKIATQLQNDIPTPVFFTEPTFGDDETARDESQIASSEFSRMTRKEKLSFQQRNRLSNALFAVLSRL